jgi:HK97 gp10 family phage protein
MANNLGRFNQRRSASSSAWAGGFVDPTELYAFAADLEAAAEGVVEDAQEVVAKALYDIEARGKAGAAVDTGFLRSSIRVQFDADRLGGRVGPSASYAWFVERGTSVMPPRPFMEPAAAAVEPGFLAAIEQMGGRGL